MINDALKQVVDITNNIENFIPYATIFVTNWPHFVCPGIKCNITTDDGWSWLDFPYYEINNLSPIARGLRLLVRKAYCRLTYKVFDDLPDIMIIRIYLLPLSSKYDELLRYYRQNFFRFKKSFNSLEKQCLITLQHILSLADFSKDAFNINSTNELINYLKNNKIILIKALLNEPNVIDLKSLDSQTIKFHLQRLIDGKPYDKEPFYDYASKKSLLQRLNEIYLKIKSPHIDRKKLYNDEDSIKLYDMINNNEIQGFKSELYNFQKRSVLKMLERESIQSKRLMPNILEVKNDPYQLEKYYIDINTLMPVTNTPYYVPPKGGILAENMGLGKTCICLALICISKFQISETPALYKTPDQVSKTNRSINTLFDCCVNFIAQNSISWREYYDDFPPHIVKKLESTMGYFEKQEAITTSRTTRHSSHIKKTIPFRKMFLSSTTLVVLPDNLFHQWRVEMFKHVVKNYLTTLEIPTLKYNNHLKISNLQNLLNKDVILISNSVFSKQFEIKDTALKHIYWKRLIIDEGHSMNSKTSRAVLLTKDLMFERMWIISGTPTSGLTNLHIENESQEYSIQKQFDPKQDLIKLGAVVSNFFKIEPWCTNRKLWGESIIKPFEQNEFNIDLQLSEFLGQLIVKHTIQDVESDIKLPTLHHKPVFLKPSFFDKLSINLFISVLATNAVTSERKDVDFMFHPSNKSDLRRLVTNLQKATFYWTGFSINDVENLLNICVYSLRENGNKYSDQDQNLLNNSIFISKLALSNLRWRSVTTVHEMGYFISSLPKPIVMNYSLVNYKSDIYVYGYPHLISIQKFYYKNRTIKTMQELNEKIEKQSTDFWKRYWNNIKSNKSKGNVTSRPLSNKEEYKEFELSDVNIISKLPTWVDTFDPILEENILYKSKGGSKKFKFDKKPEKIFKFDKDNIGSDMKKASIVGTLSTKLNYLTMRLLENQMQGLKSIVFYEFENSAYYLTEFLDLLGLNYLMYSPYIKISDRANNLAQFDRWDPVKNEGEGIALIMDLKLASHGLTIIAATQVFFINTVWNQSVEAQAIKRSHRIGQTKEVFVETLILENTLEEEMYKMRNEVKDSDNIELIDHTKIKDYILQFPFLKMYVDGNFNEEFADLTIPTNILRDINEGNDNRVEKESIELDCISSKYNRKTRMRKWKLPLFTKQNLNKLAMNENKGVKRRFDDIEDLKREVENSNNNINNESLIENNKTSILLDKLRSKRKRKVRFKL